VLLAPQTNARMVGQIEKGRNLEVSAL
jgi:hypothetical protein